MKKRVREYYGGEIVDGWGLIKFLGLGGNAEVWQAKRSNETFALKILHSKNPNSEPFKRFVEEVKILRQLGDYPGILPLVDFSLPDQPTRKSPAWLAMPIATTIDQARLQTASLEQVVEGIAQVAHTLASLAEGHKIAHRDIKPSNLYLYQGRWAVGDFGLVDYPQKEQLTKGGKKLGSTYYLAPEMLTHPESADGAKADVYSLAKTLWVLATGQDYPIQGEQRLDTPELRLSNNVKHLRAHYLDPLFELATKHNPNLRPTMQKLADELDAWLNPPIIPDSTTNIDDLAKRIRLLVEPEQAEQQSRQAKIDKALLVDNKLDSILDAVRDKLRGTNLKQSGPSSDDTLPSAFSQKQNAPNMPELLCRNKCIVARSLSDMSVILRYGTVMVLYEDGHLYLEANYAINNDLVWHDAYVALLGTAYQQQVIERLQYGLMENLRPALERVVQLLESAKR